MSFFRVFQHLLPRAKAWRLKSGSQIRQFFEGVASPLQSVRDYIDQIWLDIFPQTTRQLALWEGQFGIQAATVEDDRRAALAGAWAAQGGQSAYYIQTTLQTAGFDVYVHESWIPETEPAELRDPRDYTTPPAVGTWQCTGSAFVSDQPQCTAERVTQQPECNRFLANEPMYLVNRLLNGEAPPLIPSSDAFWPFFIYIGGETFPDHAMVDATRRAEFERMIMKIRPAQVWVVLLIDYV